MNLEYKKIKIGRKYAEAFLIKLLKKNFLLLKGKIGYIMCGYLDLKVAEKFQEAAVRVTGVSTIAEVLDAKVQGCTAAAKKLGIYEGQPIKEALKAIV